MNVQKKIIPCKASAPGLDPELIFQDRATKLGKSNRKLIVVASLIDKPTNLGGKLLLILNHLQILLLFYVVCLIFTK